MDLKEATEKAVGVRTLYDQFERDRYGRSWTTEEITLGLVGDVGDLAKLIQANEGIREISNVKERLAHELSDCLWSILVLADQLDIDITKSFDETMVQLEDSIRKQLSD